MVADYQGGWHQRRVSRSSMARRQVDMRRPLTGAGWQASHVRFAALQRGGAQNQSCRRFLFEDPPGLRE